LISQLAFWRQFVAGNDQTTKDCLPDLICYRFMEPPPFDTYDFEWHIRKGI
jgi:hypothetical protein